MRFKISRQTDVALQAIEYLHDHELQASGIELADHIGVGVAYVSQTLKPLIEAGWVKSRTGPIGGYVLVVSAKKLSLLEVLEVCEGPVATSQCVLDDRVCGADEPCHFHTMWAAARADFAASLSKSSVVK